MKALYSYTNLADNACRHSFQLQNTLVDLGKLAHSDPGRNRELKEILTPLTQHESPCFRYFVWCTLADILGRQNSWQEAEKAYGEAIRICKSQDDLWFRLRDQSTAALAGRMLLDAHQPEAGRLFLETYVSDFEKNPRDLSYAYVLAEIYQATERDQEALRICEVYLHAHPTSDAEGLQKKSNALRVKLKLHDSTQMVASAALELKHFPVPYHTDGIGNVYPAMNLLICSDYQQQRELFFFDVQAEKWVKPDFYGKEMRRGIGAIRVATLQGEKLFLGGGTGLWEIDLKTHAILQHYTTTNGLPFNNISALAADQHELFIGFSDGKRGVVASRRQGEHFNVFDGDEAPSGPISNLVVEPERVWVGLKQYRPQVLRLDRPAGTWQKVFNGGHVDLASTGVIITDLAPNHFLRRPDRLGAKCYAQAQANDQAATPCIVQIPARLATDQVKCLMLSFHAAVDDKDRIWFAGSLIDQEHGSGLYSVAKKTGELTLYGPGQGMPCVAVHDLKRVGPYIWAATADGLVRITPK